MAKKDFSAMNTGRAETAESSAVMRKLEQGASNKGQQGEATQQEAAERAAALRTQGRKGCKATRINMAFTPDNQRRPVNASGKVRHSRIIGKDESGTGCA